MPTYAYACAQCRHQFDAFQSIKAGPLRKCPACGKSALKRLIGTGAGLIFKGSGFYTTDYRSEGYKKAASQETGGVKEKAGDKKEAVTATQTPAVRKESTAAEKKKSA